ncbi:MAG: MATE family efflux transporter [Lachnospiraceae bacterium]|nr:MATE family efflux transporter [Lachnospiraceae bacterium]
MKPTTKSDFSKGNIAAHMLRIALPMTLAQLINVLYNIVDRIFIGRLPEDATNALTGMGVAFPICTMTIAFANLVGMGGAPLFSIERGRGDTEEARRILGTSFKLLVFIGIALSVVVFCVKEPLLYLLGASEATFGYANSYISIYLLGTIFVMLSLGMNSFINAQGFSGIGMLTVTIGAVCNLILDPIFIFGLDMGVQGAALATVISQGLAALWTLRFLLGKKAIIRLSLRNCRLEWERVKSIITLGTAGFIMAITNSAVQIVCNINLAAHGGDMYIAAMTIINSVREVVSMVVSGISNGAQPIMSFNYGAKQYGRVKATIRLMAIILLIYTLLAWLVVMIFSKQFVTMFNDDAALLPIAVKSMHIYFFGFFMMAFQFVGQTTFQALGKSKQSIFFSLFRKVIIVIPLTFALPYVAGLGVDGVFMAEPVSNFIGGLACFVTMYMLVYRRLEDNGVREK